MNYVVDASVLAEYVFAQAFTAYAKHLLESNITDVLISTEFALLEVTNVLWKQVHFYGMPLASAYASLAALRKLTLKRTPAKRLMKPALQVGVRNGLAVYDSVYIVLAHRVGAPLITLDQKQARAAAAEGITLKPLTDFVP